MIKKEERGEVGYCVFSDDSFCEEWDLFNSKCAPFENKKKEKKFCPKIFCEVFLHSCRSHEKGQKGKVTDVCFEAVQKLGMAPPVGDACSCGRKENHFKSGADVCDDCIRAVGRWAKGNCNKPPKDSEEHHHNHEHKGEHDHDHDHKGEHSHGEHSGSDRMHMNMNGEEDRNSFTHHGKAHQRNGEDDRDDEHEHERHGNFWFHIFFWENLFLLCGLCLCCAKRRKERVARRRERRQRHNGRSSSSSSTARHQFVPLQTAVVTHDTSSSGPSAPVVMMAVPIEQSAIAI